MDYECQKAQCYFRGRQWTAWFAPGIPISDGPWKFGGLPGLITEVYDQAKQYYFSIIGLEKVDDEPILFSQPISENAKHIPIDRKEFLKAQIRHLSGSVSILNVETGIPFGNNKPIYRDLIECDYR